MRRKVEGILASIGAAVCVSVAGFFWLSPSCPVPALVLLDVALLALQGSQRRFFVSEGTIISGAG